MDYEAVRKAMRRRLGSTGWTVLLYYVLVNVCVIFCVAVEAVIRMLDVLPTMDFDAMTVAVMEAAASGWGYVLAVAIGFLILMAWKKPKFWREQIWARGKPMKWGDFLAILAIFLAAQLFYQFYVMVLETGLNLMGLTLMEGVELMAVSGDNFSMFLYMAVLAPIAEELLCRGLILRTLMPYGKRMAIVGSAFLFAMFHGNILQTPFAFLVGLVLGYVAAEYSVAWAMVLHMVNNLVLGDLLNRLFPDEMAASSVLWMILLVSAVWALVVLIRRRGEIAEWKRRNPMNPGVRAAFFGSGGVVTFTVLMALSMIFTCFTLITPM